MPRRRRKFDREFKQEAVRLVTEGGHSLSQVARDLDLRPDMLRRWKKHLVDDPAGSFPGEGRSRDDEVARLKQELRRVSEERDILKEAVAIFSDRRR